MAKGVLKFLPVLCFVWFNLTFLISYAISVSLDHIHPIWPFISETGALPPESCFLSFMFITGALIMFLIVFVRFRQILLLIQGHEKHNFLRKLNVFLLVLGVLACIGITIVGAVQMTNSWTLHSVGVFLVCAVGTSYFITHVRYNSLLFHSSATKFKETLIYSFLKKGNKCLLAIRVALCVIMSITIVLGIAAVRVAFRICKCKRKTFEFLKWQPAMPGYYWKVGSSICEWLLTIIQSFYILSYYRDFSSLDYNLVFTTETIS